MSSPAGKSTEKKIDNNPKSTSDDRFTNSPVAEDQHARIDMLQFEFHEYKAETNTKLDTITSLLTSLNRRLPPLSEDISKESSEPQRSGEKKSESKIEREKVFKKTEISKSFTNPKIPPTKFAATPEDSDPDEDPSLRFLEEMSDAEEEMPLSKRKSNPRRDSIDLSNYTPFKPEMSDQEEDSNSDSDYDEDEFAANKKLTEDQKVQAAKEKAAESGRIKYKKRIVVATAPPFPHELKNFTIPHIIFIKREIYNYQRLYSIEVKLGSIMTPAARGHLIVENCFNIGELKFDRLSERRLWKYVRVCAMPLSEIDWIASFRSAVKFPDLPADYHPSLHNFRILYHAFVQYCRLFLNVYNYLSQAKKLIPPLWSAPKIPEGVREETLVSIFCSMVPFKTGGPFHKLLIKTERVDTIEKYLHKICQELNAFHKAALQMRSLGAILYMWTEGSRARQKESRSTAAALHSIEDSQFDEYAESFFADQDLLPAAPPAPQRAPPPRPPPLPETARKQVTMLNNVASPPLKKPFDKSAYGCPRLAEKKQCTPPCEYSHNPDLVAKTRDYMVKRLLGHTYGETDKLLLKRPTGYEHSARNNHQRTDMHAVTPAWDDIIPENDTYIPTDYEYEDILGEQS